MMDFIIEFWEFVKVRKKFWLLPPIIILLSGKKFFKASTKVKSLSFSDRESFSLLSLR